ncbi:MAG: DUF1273 family protein [Clostridia bacterium]|nr:DUF1273 family protein [Clostridia bacterium]
MQDISCCFTGYRPEKFPFSLEEDSDKMNIFENKLYNVVFSLPVEGVFRFYCGMAEGFDIIAAEAVLTLREAIKTSSVELIAVIPFKAQAAGFSESWKARYDKIIEAADKVIVLSDKYFSGCYAKRNYYMVDNSNIVLTYFDGKAGGTRSTINYALKKGKKIINVAEYGVGEYFPEENSYFIEEQI